MFAIHRRQLRTTLLALALGTAAASITGLSQAAADNLPAFTCTDRSGGSNGVAGTVTDIRVAHHDGYDRFVIGFATSLGVPPYELHRQAASTFVRDASGQPATLDGSAGIRVVLRGSDIADGVPSNLRPQLPEVREVANIGNFERVVSYGVGLTDQACVRAFELSGPSRLVIDVQTAPDATSPNAATAATPATHPSSLAATGHTASANQPGSMPLAAILGLLAVAAGLSVLGLRRFRKQ